MIPYSEILARAARHAATLDGDVLDALATIEAAISGATHAEAGALLAALNHAIATLRDEGKL